MPDQIVHSYRFRYDNASRIVDNVTFENERGCIVGYEVRRSGKFSHKIKRYKLDQIKNLERVELERRNRP